MVPSPTAKIGCVRTPPPSCRENHECADGWACVQESCRPICATDVSCLSNERCDRGACKPLCRRDDDCRNGELCQDLICSIGCRSNSHCPGNLACINQQCVDPCLAPTACGTNANCIIRNHLKACICPDYLVGDANIGCKYPPTACSVANECPPNHACIGNLCQTVCSSDQNCLTDEKCVRSTCKSICNSDASCGNGQICENRLCEIGCRNDLSCAGSQSCINNQCIDPCSTNGQCGQCADCSVINHGVQCSCPVGFLGNPLTSCSLPLQRCNSNCQCDESGVYCAELCSSDVQCACGQKCGNGKCRTRCNPGACAEGQLCQNGACIAGCRNNLDCSSDRSCLNGQCLDPCLLENACGNNALCRVSEHRILCLCPDGFRGEPTQGCIKSECTIDNDCEIDKRCQGGSCINPCLRNNACGVNAQCRVVNRQSQCTCPPGHFGNPLVECVFERSACSRNPCGENTLCRDVSGGYECSCVPGCTGDPQSGCVCIDNVSNICRDQPCGRNAACRVISHDIPECYCPPTYPNGDPYHECKSNAKPKLFRFKTEKINERNFLENFPGTQYRDNADCRVHGCTVGECIRQGTEYVCKNGKFPINFCHLFAESWSFVQFHVTSIFLCFQYFSAKNLFLFIEIMTSIYPIETNQTKQKKRAKQNTRDHLHI